MCSPANAVENALNVTHIQIGVEAKAVCLHFSARHLRSENAAFSFMPQRRMCCHYCRTTAAATFRSGNSRLLVFEEIRFSHWADDGGANESAVSSMLVYYCSIQPSVLGKDLEIYAFISFFLLSRTEEKCEPVIE